jgi:hypothetical protein
MCSTCTRRGRAMRARQARPGMLVDSTALTPTVRGDAVPRDGRAERTMGAERGDYGAVRILRGPHKGKLAYYDDDLGTESRPGKAVVYLGEPFESDYILVRRTDLAKVNAKSIHVERWKRKYPWLARQLGLP